MTPIINRPPLSALYLKAEGGPDGAPAAFMRLEAALGGTRGRHFWGWLHGGEYRACVLRRPDDDPKVLGLEECALAGGAYVRARHHGPPAALHETFAALRGTHDADPTRPCLEEYRRADEVYALLPTKVVSKVAEHWTQDTELDERKREALDRQLTLSGLLAEVRAAQHVASKRWMVRLRPTYLDRDEQKAREYDLAICSPGIYRDETESGLVVTHLCAAVEVKTARTTPWVLVRPPEGTMYADGRPPLGLKLEGLLSAPHPWLRRLTALDHPAAHTPAARDGHWHAASLVEPFEGRSPEHADVAGMRRGPANSFMATQTAWKASRDLLESELRREESNFERQGNGTIRGSLLVVSKPVIVLDGMLLGWWSRQDGSTQCSKIRWGSLHTEVSSSAYGRGACAIDVVTLDAVPDYIAHLQQLVTESHDLHVDAWGLRTTGGSA